MEEGLIGIIGVLMGIVIQYIIQNRIELKKRKIEIVSELIGEMNQLKEVANEKDIFVFQIVLDNKLLLRGITTVKSVHSDNWFENLQRLDERIFNVRASIFKLSSKLKGAYGNTQKEIYKDIKEHMVKDSFNQSTFEDWSDEELVDVETGPADVKKEIMKNNSTEYYRSVNSIINRLNGILSSLMTFKAKWK